MLKHEQLCRLCLSTLPVNNVCVFCIIQMCHFNLETHQNAFNGRALPRARRGSLQRSSRSHNLREETRMVREATSNEKVKGKRNTEKKKRRKGEDKYLNQTVQSCVRIDDALPTDHIYQR